MAPQVLMVTRQKGTATKQRVTISKKRLDLRIHSVLEVCLSGVERFVKRTVHFKKSRAAFLLRGNITSPPILGVTSTKHWEEKNIIF